MNEAEYLQKRVEEQINWMEEKSSRSQRKYKLLKLAEITAAAAIPFLAGFQPENKKFSIIIGLLGMFIVVLNGVQQLYKYHENWLAYRTTIETLKREKFLFQSKANPYNGEHAFEMFVQNFEALLADENKKWKETWMQKSEGKTSE